MTSSGDSLALGMPNRLVVSTVRAFITGKIKQHGRCAPVAWAGGSHVPNETTGGKISGTPVENRQNLLTYYLFFGLCYIPQHMRWTPKQTKRRWAKRESVFCSTLVV